MADNVGSGGSGGASSTTNVLSGVEIEDVEEVALKVRALRLKALKAGQKLVSPKIHRVIAALEAVNSAIISEQFGGDDKEDEDADPRPTKQAGRANGNGAHRESKTYTP